MPGRFWRKLSDVSETEALFTVLRQSADASAVAAIEQLIRDASDHELCRVNVLDFAAKRRLDEERAIATFLHAARLGLLRTTLHAKMRKLGISRQDL